MMDELDRAVAKIKAEQSQKRLGALSRADSYREIKAHPPSWRVRPVISTDDYGTLAGPKGVGKTFALIDLGVSVSLGEPWLGRLETEPARVLLFTSEDSRARLWRRADAIAVAAGHNPDELEGRLFVHPLAFSAVGDLSLLRAELEVVEPGLVLLDPAYRYMNGVRAQLFDMGAVLTPLQEVCSAVGAPLLVGHHYNRREGAQREERISGAGLLEWARLVITMDAPPRRDESDVVATFEITGNSIDPVTFRLRRHVQALDDSPDPELVYQVEVLAEGAEVRETRFMTAADRVLAILPGNAEDAVSVKEIGDLVAQDMTGHKPLRADTIRKALNRDLDGQVDSVGDRMSTRWWRT
jgi:hypothetical protein